MEGEEIKEELIRIFNTIIISGMFNSYAMECVIMGTLQPNDKIPVERFVKDLALERLYSADFQHDLEGCALSSTNVRI